MRISFDLDDTLFVSEENFKVEPPLKFPFSVIYKERLRLGTVALMKYIREQGMELWVYTTSFRSEQYIRGLFRCYGIKFDSIVNGARHAREVQAGRTEAMPSKYPGRYRIDLHIDDDRSVAENGRTYGFHVLIVGGQDDNWTDSIIKEIERIRKSQES
ncbi:MAG: HAD family hydrolase [Lachnospiraceae bacterium]|nr:HAD family hydrolase [Lachnospiraceae bacterium]